MVDRKADILGVYGMVFDGFQKKAQWFAPIHVAKATFKSSHAVGIRIVFYVSCDRLLKNALAPPIWGHLGISLYLPLSQT